MKMKEKKNGKREEKTKQRLLIVCLFSLPCCTWGHWRSGGKKLVRHVSKKVGNKTAPSAIKACSLLPVCCTLSGKKKEQPQSRCTAIATSERRKQNQSLRACPSLLNICEHHVTRQIHNKKWQSFDPLWLGAMPASNPPINMWVYKYTNKKKKWVYWLAIFK